MDKDYEKAVQILTNFETYDMFKLFLILFFLNAQSQVEVVFDEGNALYNQGNYNEAIEKYTSIINTV